MISQAEFLARTVRHLERVDIPYMVVGSLASTFHGEPRTTQDVDIVVDPTPDALNQLVDDLGADGFYVDADAAVDALRQRTQFNAIDRESGWKVDLIIRHARPFSIDELRRRLPAELLGVRTFVATAEDTILAKLEWAKAGESERQLRDVAAILEMNRDTLDYPYIQRWVADLDLADAWARARRLAEIEGAGAPD